jgi:restriction system protein
MEAPLTDMLAYRQLGHTNCRRTGDASHTNVHGGTIVVRHEPIGSRSPVQDSTRPQPDRKSLPFVGREVEMRWLRRQLVFERKRVVEVTGPAGSGKTALMFMLEKALHKEYQIVSYMWLGGQDVDAASQSGHVVVIDQAERDVRKTRALAVEVVRAGGQFVAVSRESVFDESTVPTLHLQGLPAHETESLLTTRLRLSRTSPDLTQRLAVKIWQELRDQSGGVNPRLALELAGVLSREAWQPKRLEDGAISLPPLDGVEYPGLITPDGLPLGKDKIERVAIETSHVNAQLMATLAERPWLMWQLSPRKWEELVADFFEQAGWEATLSPIGRDNGIDIFVSRKGLGSFLCLVECKQQHPERRVTADVVAKLYGEVNRFNAAAGFVVTTSLFTQGARAFQRDVRTRMDLRDYFDAVEWLRRGRLLASPADAS